MSEVPDEELHAMADDMHMAAVAITTLGDFVKWIAKTHDDPVVRELAEDVLRKTKDLLL